MVATALVFQFQDAPRIEMGLIAIPVPIDGMGSIVAGETVAPDWILRIEPG